MIEIKSIGGEVLYTAETATDVRAALIEAVDRGADLRGANLRGADLGGADLGGADLGDADLRDAYLRDAYLRDADLRDADLRDADLRDADLRDAYLRGADLGGADLGDANLRDANLRDAKGVNPYVTTPLHILADQPGRVRAYKLVNADGEGPFNGGIVYRVGESVEAAADTDPEAACAAGINVATLDWCLKEWRQGYRILLVEFTAEDIAAIPHGSDGKFRVHRCDVVGEKDLVEVGLIDPETAAVGS